MKIKIELEVELEDWVFDPNDQEEKDNFENTILVGDGSLVLHSNEIGDTIGVVYQVNKIEFEVKDQFMLKQEKGYGCGLYAVANVLDLKDFITPQRLEKSKKGVTRFELSKYLQEGIEKLNGKSVEQNGKVYKTEYGRVAIINENGKKKVDFNNSKFNSTMDFIGFLKNETLTTQILGY